MPLADPVAVFRQMLHTKASLRELCGSRIYGSVRELRVPPDYRPDVNGPCIAFVVGMGSQDQSGAIHTHPVELRSIAATEEMAHEIVVAVFEQVNDRRYPPILIARESQGRQVMQEPDTGWYAGLASYEIQIAQPARELITR